MVLISFGFTCFLQNPSIRSLWQLILFNRNKVSIFLFISTCSVSLISQEKGGFLVIDSLFIHVPKGYKKFVSFTLWVLIHIHMLFSLSFPCCIFFSVLKYIWDSCMFLSYYHKNHDLRIVSRKSLVFRWFSASTCQKTLPSLSFSLIKKGKKLSFSYSNKQKPFDFTCFLLSSLLFEFFLFF